MVNILLLYTGCLCNWMKIRNFISHSLYLNCFYFVKNIVHSDSCSRCPDIYHNVKRNNKSSLETYRFRLCFDRNLIQQRSEIKAISIRGKQYLLFNEMLYFICCMCENICHIDKTGRGLWFEVILWHIYFLSIWY